MTRTIAALAASPTTSRSSSRSRATTSDAASYLVDTDDDPAALAARSGWTPIADRAGTTVTVSRADVRYARRAETTVPRDARIALGIGLLACSASASPTRSPPRSPIDHEGAGGAALSSFFHAA